MNLEALDLKRAGDLAYTSIRDAIIGGRLEPDCRLNQDELARRLGVSRGPVRDALRRLEGEGLVKTLAKRGVVVATIASQELKNIFELRAVLDSYSHRLACERIGAQDLGRLQQILDRTEALTPDGDIHELVRAHAEFHFVIYAACGNPELERVARSLWDRSYRYRVIALSTKAIARLTLDEHREILAALREQNAQRVEALLVQHNRVSIERLLPGVAGAEATTAVASPQPAVGGPDNPQ